MLGKNVLGTWHICEGAMHGSPEGQVHGAAANLAVHFKIMYGTINSGALKQRKIDCVQVAPHELAYSKATRHDNVRKKLSPNSHKLDPGLQ